MQISRIMKTDPRVVSPDETVDKVFGLMISHSIRHLPVMKDGKLVGIVSDRDVRQSFIPHLSSASAQKRFFIPHSLKTKDIMTDHPLFVSPDADVEEAAKIISEHQISALPVMDGDNLVGIVTETDLLRVFIDLLGMIKSSSRIDVVIKNEQEDLKQILQILKEKKMHLISIGISQINEEGSKVYFFRLERDEAAKLAPALVEGGFQVVGVVNNL